MSLASPGTDGRRLRVRVGPSVNTLATVNVNEDSAPMFVASPHFIGHVVVRVKNFDGITPDGGPPVASSAYFGSKRRLFSIQATGRFLREWKGDDLFFGAVFERKVNPPTGSWLALKFGALIDPALAHDLYGAKPWFLSPLVCSMNTISVQPAPSNSPPVAQLASLHFGNHASPELAMPSKELTRRLTNVKGAVPPKDLLGDWPWGGSTELVENNALLLRAPPATPPFPADSSTDRRKYFQKAEARSEVAFSPDKVYSFEIFAPFINFNTMELSLGLNIKLTKYADNQPYRLVVKTRSKHERAAGAAPSSGPGTPLSASTGSLAPEELVFCVVEFDLVAPDGAEREARSSIASLSEEDREGEHKVRIPNPEEFEDALE